MTLLGLIPLLGGLTLGMATGAQVMLPYGSVNGNTLQQCKEYLGIPFAAKPDRFMPPRPWTLRFPGGHLEATKYTPACMQLERSHSPITSGYSEDCLHLNIYTPIGTSTDGTNWPVMVWIHGGGLTTGSAMIPLYNGSQLAAKEKVVVVAINYRLNFFGFGVTMRSDGRCSANNGFRDQREGLRWVRKHIAAFGGDASSVTIFGESAGGQSTTTHVLTLGSRGLFDRAISESGDMLNVASMIAAQDMTKSVTQQLKCAGTSPAEQLACLQRADKNALLQAANGSGPGAVVDMDVYEADPLTLIASGKFNKVPFMFGNNADEGNLFVYPPLANTTSASATDVKCAIMKAFGDEMGEEVLQIYAPVNTVGIDNRNIVAEIFGDVVFHCDNRKVAQALSKAGVAPWVYSFNRQPSCPIWPGAHHGAEIAYVFQTFNATTSSFPNSTCKTSPDDVRLSEKVSAMWAAFARTGRIEGWPRFDSPGNEVNLNVNLGLLEALDTELGRRRSQCDAMDRIGALRSYILGAEVLSALLQCQGGAFPSSMRQHSVYV